MSKRSCIDLGGLGGSMYISLCIFSAILPYIR